MIEDLREAARSLPACIASSALIGWGLVDEPGVGLVLGSVAAGARVGPLAGLLFAALGLLLGGAVGPVVWQPENLVLLAVGLALGAVELWRSGWRWLISVALLVGLALAHPTARIWAAGIVVGMIGGRVMLPERFERHALAAAGLAALVGLGLSINKGFTRAGNTTSRALLVGDRVLAAGHEDAFWSWGQPATFQAAPGGPTFAVVPQGRTLPRDGATAADRAEVGQVDCEALVPEALEGDLRAQVQAARHGCDPLDALAGDPFVDAARVLAGLGPQDAARIHAVELADPLDAPSAVVLAARARLENPRPAALTLVDGTPYDRAVLMAELHPDDVQSVEDLVTTWASEVPESVRGPYDRALAALATARPAR